MRQTESPVGGLGRLREQWGEGRAEMTMSGERYSLIKDIIESDSFQLVSWKSIDFDHLNHWVDRILVDDVFHAYLEYFCFEKRIPMKHVIDHLEKAIIVWALMKQDGNLKKTALFLDVELATLSRKLARYSIQIQEFRDGLSREQT